MRSALRNAGLNPEQVQYINAHGTSTPQGDKAETLAVKSMFGDYAYHLAMKNDSFRDHVLDQLRGLDVFDDRAMFGGHGLYSDRTMFGIIFKGCLYFKTSAATRAEYERRQMKPFRPNARQTLKSYYEVPADIIEAGHELIAWARLAIHADDEN